jgi:TP53 regulating kinase and related kinases
MSTLEDTSPAIAQPPLAPHTTLHDPPASQLPYPFNQTHNPAPTLIAQGAEALLYRTHYLSPSQAAALKFRPSKKYRHQILDERLTKQRVLAEARVLVKLAGVPGKQGWNVPVVWGVEWDVGRRVRGEQVQQQQQQQVDSAAAGGNGGRGKGAWLLMEWVEGRSVKDLIGRWDLWFRGLGSGEGDEEIRGAGVEKLKMLLRRIGRAVAGMHSAGGVIHGDLTSSNVLVRKVGATADVVGDDGCGESHGQVRPDLGGEVVLIDFGLATQSVQEEDRAVDLYVLERAFGSTHPRQEQWFDQEVLQSEEGYRGAYKGATTVLKRLEDVRLRGRKRSMIG